VTRQGPDGAAVVVELFEALAEGEANDTLELVVTCGSR